MRTDITLHPIAGETWAQLKRRAEKHLGTWWRAFRLVTRDGDLYDQNSETMLESLDMAEVSSVKFSRLLTM